MIKLKTAFVVLGSAAAIVLLTIGLSTHTPVANGPANRTAPTKQSPTAKEVIASGDEMASDENSSAEQSAAEDETPSPPCPTCEEDGIQSIEPTVTPSPRDPTP